MSTELRPKKRNDLFLVVKEMGFDPVEFEWREVNGEWAGFTKFSIVPALVHKPTSKVFSLARLPSDGFVNQRGPWAIYSAPGEEGPSAVSEYNSWDTVLDEARQWLRRVREDSGPDLWALAAEQRRLLESGEGLPNTPFSPDERKRLFASLDRLHDDFLQTQELDAERTAALRIAIEGGKSAAGRLGRKDWVMYFLGTVTSLAISSAFAPDQARHLWQLAVQAVQWVLQTPPLLLGS